MKENENQTRLPKRRCCMNDSVKALNHIIEIAQSIHLSNEASQLNYINQNLYNTNPTLVLPLIGEFSAGKTALINALTDAKNLETATRPTTATIYEIHFGADKCYAEICDENGETTNVEDMSTLKNANLKDSVLVNIFDTSTRVPSGIVLVDTPGLSSPDARHKHTLVNFLPKADGILLVTDINQQITRSLTDFIKDMELAKRPVFLVITKCDTKAPSEIESVKKYIAQNCELPLSKVVCVSATNGEIDELCTLIQSIQNEKSKILAQVDGQRVQAIIRLMIAHIDEMLNTASSDTELENAIHQKETALRRMERNIERFISSTQIDIKEEKQRIIKKFHESVFERLDVIVTQKSIDFNTESATVIWRMSSIYLNEFKTNLRNLISRKCREQSPSDDSLPIQSLLNTDLSQISCEKFSFDLDLNSIGHEYDSKISGAVSLVLHLVSNLLLYNAGAHIAMISMANIMDNAIQMITKGTNKIVNHITDHTLGKPQRHKAIHHYIDDVIVPEFTIAMNQGCDGVIADISDKIRNHAEMTLKDQKAALAQLLAESQNSQETYHQHKLTLQQYKTDLLEIINHKQGMM